MYDQLETDVELYHGKQKSIHRYNK